MLLLELLKADFKRKKAKNSHYSMRAYANYLGLSASLLSLWLNGKKQPTLDSFAKIENQLNLNLLEKTKIIEEIEAYEKNKKPKRYKKRYRLNPNQHALVSRWEVPAILSLARINNNEHSATWIASQLGIQAEVAIEIFSLLEENGYIQKKGTGFVANQNGIFAASESPSEYIREFHKQILLLAQDSISSCPVEERYLMGLTIPFSLDGMKEIQAEVKNFCNRVSKVAEKYDKSQKAYQLAVQFFPLSGREK